METTIGGPALEALKDGLKGDAYVPGEGDYDRPAPPGTSTPTRALRSSSWPKVLRTCSPRCAWRATKGSASG